MARNGQKDRHASQSGSGGILSRLRNGTHQLRRRMGIPSLGQLRRLPQQVEVLQHELQRAGTVNRELSLAARVRDSDLQQELQAQSATIRQLIQVHPVMDATAASDQPVDGPLVSVVLFVVRFGPQTLRAVESVCAQWYTNWELIVVCDNGSDITKRLLGQCLNDRRIRLVAGFPGEDGHARVPNELLNGAVIATIEENNEWMPFYLNSVVPHYVGRRDVESVVCTQLAGDSLNVAPGVSVGSVDTPAGVPVLSVVTWRREAAATELFEGEWFTRQSFVGLLAALPATRVRQLAVVGSRCEMLAGRGISSGGEEAWYRYCVLRQQQRPIKRKLKVLYAVWDYPQLTESYVRWEIDCMQRWGVDIEVWSELERPESPYPSPVPIHHGSLEDVIRTVAPHVVHFHWINIAAQQLSAVTRAGLPATVRGHGFEFQTGQVTQLLGSSTIQGLYLFPHFAQQCADHPRLHAMNSAFHGDLYSPGLNKETGLVVRVGSAKPTKGVKTFIDVARACPGQRFVLVLGRLPRLGHYVDEIQAYNEACGSPVDIQVNLPVEQVAALIRRAGIYLHTYGDDEPFGMPISIAEAMATGCYVLVRNLPGAREYIGPGGHLYDTAEDAAVLIRLAQQWYPGQWREQQRRSVEHACARHADVEVLRPLLQRWISVVERGADPSVAVRDAFAEDTRRAITFLRQEAEELLHYEIYGHPYLLHLLGTCRRLRNWKSPAAVEQTGLLHSIYVSWGRLKARLEPDPERQRRLADAVGDEAAQLLYTFGAVSREDLFRSLRTGSPHRVSDRFVDRPMVLSDSMFRNLCLVHLAEWMEKWKRLPEGHASISDYGAIAAFLGGAALSDFVKEVLSPVTTDSVRETAEQCAA